MKRLLICVSILIASAWAVGAAEEAAHPGGEGNVTLWKVANFVLLAGGLGYLIRKKGGAFFGGRSRQIQQAIEEAAQMKAEAEARARQIEERLANLSSEVEALRGNARQETAAEADRARARLAEELGKIQAQAEREIAAAARAARMELRGYAADLAVRLAEQQLRERITPEVEERLTGAAIEELGQISGGGTGVGRTA